MVDKKEFEAGEKYRNHGQFRSTVTRNADDDVAHGVVRNKHELKADEPEWIEEPGAGNDQHPSPADYMTFGLLACQVEVLDQALQKARIRGTRSMPRQEWTESEKTNLQKKCSHITPGGSPTSVSTSP
jgi:uncharacterized OsmC-like protein